jgi:Ca2+-binding EF-hand superfamily protein
MHVRAMANRAVPREEVAAHVRKMFERLDTNHDGYVTRQEASAFHARMEGMHGGMVAMHERMEAMHPRMAAAMRGNGVDPNVLFDRLDTNHDGVISREEFMNGRARMRERRMMRGGVGARWTVPPIPAPAMPGMAPVRRTNMRAGGNMPLGGRMFEMADTNHDGRISLQEAEALALAHFDRMDLNHDGRVTPEERRQARTMRMERRSS